MEAKCYRAMRRAHGKMLREYFSGVSVETNVNKDSGFRNKKKSRQELNLSGFVIDRTKT